MNKDLTSLISILELELIENNSFLGKNINFGLNHIFGGQVIAQALYAAKRTLPSERIVHSIHTYFLISGDCEKPIHYHVEPVRDGKHFSMRRILATQDDKTIFYMTASFQKHEEGFEHQSTMPSVPHPEELLTEQQHWQAIIDCVPKPYREFVLSEKAFEQRPVQFNNPFKGKKNPPIQAVWFKANGELPSALEIHQSLLAYASDLVLLPTALLPHEVGILQPQLHAATIDHAMWFHRPFNFEEWVLFSFESTSASNGRGFVRGQFFNRNGILLASVTQEGLIRYHPT